MISISFFSKRVLQQEEEDNRYNFMTNVESMKKIAKNYLISEQGYVDNWAYYISSNDMTLDEAWSFLKSINTNEKRMAHIVDVVLLKHIQLIMMVSIQLPLINS